MRYVRTYGLILALLISLVSLTSGQISINKQDVKCFGGSDGSILVTVANATEPITYKWSDGLSGRARIGLQAGEYTVTITDATKCDKVKTVQIEEPEKPLEIEIKTQPSGITPPCNEIHPVNVVARADGGTPNYIINGSPNVYTTQISWPTTLTIVAEDANGCIAEKRRRILVGIRLCPRDPNDVLGPGGVGEQKWISKYDTLDYTIRFENDPVFAMAPAQHVFIEQEFDEEINPYSFRLGTFGFGDFSFEVPGNTAQFQKRYDLTAEYDVFLDVVAGLDIANNRAFWSMTAIDPATGLQPADPLVGFLPINDTLTGSGEGFVTFSVKPASNTQTGDTTDVQASIVFNTNEPLVTNNWTNLIDALPPTTALDALPAELPTDSVLLTWSGSDDPGGSGIRNFNIYMSRDSTPFKKLTTVQGDTASYLHIGEPGSSYAFYIVGVDSVGNTESKSMAETSTVVLPPKSIELDVLAKGVYCAGDTVMLSWQTVLIDSLDLEFTIDSGGTYSTIFGGLDATFTSLDWIVPDSLGDTSLRIYLRAAGLETIYDSTNVILTVSPPPVDAGQDTSLCPGEFLYLFANGANTYDWSPQIGLNDTTSPVQPLTVDTTTEYVLTGVDIFGCRNTDTIVVSALPIPVDSFFYSICVGDSIYAGGAWQDTAGVYTDIEVGYNGCDSIVVSVIELNDPCTWAGGNIAYVDSAATGANNGFNWTDAFTDLRSAFAAAHKYVNIDEIWVAKGTYLPAETADRAATFRMKDTMEVYGGFNGTEVLRTERLPNLNPVLLSGDLGVETDSSDNAFHVLTVDSSCTDCLLDGVFITSGMADGDSTQDKSGAGVFSHGIATFRDVVIENNSSESVGAAIYAKGSTSTLTVVDCVIRLNVSASALDVVNLLDAHMIIKGQTEVKDDD